MTRVVMADDDARMRDYLRTLLTDSPSLELAGEAADGEGALRLVQALDPDLLLIDVVMPGLNGIGATRRAIATNHRLRVLVFSLYTDRRLVQAALAAGASGYLLKELLAEELPRALDALARGETYLSSALPLP